MESLHNILPNKKHLLANNEDISINVNLSKTEKELNEYNISYILSLNEQFNKERNTSTKYKLTGSLDYVSFVRDKSINWVTKSDVFTKKTTGKSFLDDFNVYVVYNSSIINLHTNLYIKKYTKLTNVNDFVLDRIPMASNLYNELNSKYIFNKEVDINGLVTSIPSLNIELPITDLYLYFEYKGQYTSSLQQKSFSASYPSTKVLNSSTTYGYNENYNVTNFNTWINQYIRPSTISTTDFVTFYSETINYYLKTYNIEVTANNLSINAQLIKYWLEVDNNWFGLATQNIVNGEYYGDLCTIDKETFTFTDVEKLKYVITYSNSTQPVSDFNPLKFSFEPFYKINIKDFSSFYEVGNPTTLENIPSYAILKSNGDYVWRDLLDIGFIEPESNLGVDYPYINGLHYIHDTTTFYFRPYLNDFKTKKLFSEFETTLLVSSFNLNDDLNKPNC